MGANHTRPQYARKVAIFGLFWHFWAFDPTSQVFFTPVDGLYDWILSFSIQYVCKDDVGTSFLKINFFPYSPPNGPLCTVGHFKGVGGEFVKIKAKCTCWCIFNQIFKHLLRDKVFIGGGGLGWNQILQIFDRFGPPSPPHVIKNRKSRLSCKYCHYLSAKHSGQASHCHKAENLKGWLLTMSYLDQSAVNSGRKPLWGATK